MKYLKLFESFSKDYKLLLEFKFYNSKDYDSPGNKRTVKFNEDDEYPKIEGDTHGLLSHAIKHYKEFDKEYVNNILLKISKDIIINYNGDIFVSDKNNNIIASGDEAKEMVKEWLIKKPSKKNPIPCISLLNTMDMIQDKKMNNEGLNDIEKEIYSYIEEMANKYEKLIDDKIDKSINIEEGDHDITELVNKQSIIQFNAVYKNSKRIYYLDFSDSSLIAQKGDELSTCFRIDKRGNDITKIKEYFDGVDEINNKLKEYFDGIETTKIETTKIEKIQKIKKHQKLVTGKDLIDMGIEGNKIRKILNRLNEIWLKNPDITKEDLLGHIDEIIKNIV